MRRVNVSCGQETFSLLRVMGLTGFLYTVLVFRILALRVQYNVHAMYLVSCGLDGTKAVGFVSQRCDALFAHVSVGLGWLVVVVVVLVGLR